MERGIWAPTIKIQHCSDVPIMIPSFHGREEDHGSLLCDGGRIGTGARMVARDAREDRKKVGDDIKSVEFGWPIGMPVCRPLGKGLYEVRTNLKDTISRVLFAIEGDKMVLLHGFIKKSQTTPLGDLDLARARLQAFRRS